MGFVDQILLPKVHDELVRLGGDMDLINLIRANMPQGFDWTNRPQPVPEGSQIKTEPTIDGTFPEPGVRTDTPEVVNPPSAPPATEAQ